MSPSPSHRRPCDCTEKVSDCNEVKYVGLQLQARLVCAAPGLSAERPNQAAIGPDTATTANYESKTSGQESAGVAGWHCEKCVRPRCAAVPEAARVDSEDSTFTSLKTAANNAPGLR